MDRRRGVRGGSAEPPVTAHPGPPLPASSARAPTSGEAGEPDPMRLLLAFAAIYFVWGSTYLAIRWAIETMPPLGMASFRFLVAGSLMYAWARSRGVPRPTRREWRDASISGVLLLAGGNGAVVVAEQWVPSGLVALLVACVPLWLVVLDALFGSRVRPSRRTTVALLIGLVGVGLLGGAPGVGAGGTQEVVGALLALFAAFSWAAGSLYSRYSPSRTRPRMLVAMQMLSGSLVLGLLSAATGDGAGFSVADVSVKSWLALAYLVVAGALVGYAAYIWLLTVVAPARVGTYAYVNPVVAMLLGWALADEPLSGRSLAAASIILGSVVSITLESRPPLRHPRGRS